MSRRPLSYSAEEVASRITGSSAERLYRIRSGSTNLSDSGYSPNQSLYDGTYQPLDRSDFDMEGELPPLNSSSPAPGNHRESSTPSWRFRDSQPLFPQGGDINSSRRLITLIQDQQKTLQAILDNQRKLENQQNSFERQLRELKEQVDSSLSSSSPGGSRVRGRPKTRITRDLTVIYLAIAFLVTFHLYLLFFSEESGKCI